MFWITFKCYILTFLLPTFVVVVVSAYQIGYRLPTPAMISCYPWPTNDITSFDLCRMVPSNRLVHAVRVPEVGNNNNCALSICMGKYSSAVYAYWWWVGNRELITNSWNVIEAVHIFGSCSILFTSDLPTFK